VRYRSVVRTLVTGGAGFIGHHLVHALVERGDDVVVLDDLRTGRAARFDAWRDRLDLQVGDVRDDDAVARAMAGCEVVVHLAALPSAARSLDDPSTTVAINRDGTATVMAAAARLGVRRVVLAGSSSVYGDAPGFPRRETQTPAPRSPYAVSKLAAEGIVHEVGVQHGIATVVLRYFYVYGPGQDPGSRYAAVVPRFIVAALQGDEVEVHGDGHQSRDFTYVGDVVAANLLAISSRATGLTCNVAGGRERSLLDLVAAIEATTGQRLAVRHGAPRAGDVRRSMADLQLAERTLGFRPAVPFEDGLHRTVEWYGARVGSESERSITAVTTPVTG
jgi:UDP-glucose 4-epimerase